VPLRTIEWLLSLYEPSINQPQVRKLTDSEISNLPFFDE